MILLDLAEKKLLFRVFAPKTPFASKGVSSSNTCGVVDCLGSGCLGDWLNPLVHRFEDDGTEANRKGWNSAPVSMEKVTQSGAG